jgi:hypothetical protein
VVASKAHHFASCCLCHAPNDDLLAASKWVSYTRVFMPWIAVVEFWPPAKLWVQNQLFKGAVGLTRWAMRWARFHVHVLHTRHTVPCPNAFPCTFGCSHPWCVCHPTSALPLSLCVHSLELEGVIMLCSQHDLPAQTHCILS